MPSKYRINDHQNLHFITFATVNWIDVSRPEYKEILVNSFKYCITNKGLELYAWVIMRNHVHLIDTSKEDQTLYKMGFSYKLKLGVSLFCENWDNAKLALGAIASMVKNSVVKLIITIVVSVGDGIRSKVC